MIKLSEKIDCLTKNEVIRALRVTRGNVSQAAELVGLPLRTMNHKLKKFDMETKEKRDAVMMCSETQWYLVKLNDQIGGHK